MSEHEQADKVREAIEKMLKEAQSDDSLSKPFTTELKTKETFFTKPSADDLTYKKTLTGFKTGTFLDGLFFGKEDKPIEGIPFGINSLLTGLPNSGKSILGEEIVLKVAQERKVCYVLSEETFRASSARYDLEARMKEKAKILGIDWKTIESNLYVLDTVMNAELRDWHTFVQAYRNLVENEKIEFLFVDSMTQLEDSRGAVKFRLLELCRYNQKHSITAFFIVQRAIEETDGFATSGGLALSHIADIVIELDYKKLSSWDSAIKMDLGVKQGETAYFFRVLKCRLCGFNAKYIGYEINKDGFVRFTKKQV